MHVELPESACSCNAGADQRDQTRARETDFKVFFLLLYCLMYYQEYIRDKSVQLCTLTISGIFLKWRNTSHVGMVTLLIVLWYAWILATSSELVSIVEDANMGPNYTAWWSWEKTETLLKELSALHIIRMPKEEQGKNLPHSILAVERGVRMCLIPFLQQLNAKPLEEWMIAKKKILQLTADKLLMSHWTCAMN